MSFGAKAKGSRLEYQLRDHLRALGYASERVVLSGAHKDHPGDVYGDKDGARLLFECKSRKDSFKSIYHELKERGGTYSIGIDDASRTAPLVRMLRFNLDGVCVVISESLEGVLAPHQIYYHLYANQPIRTYKKILGLQKMVKKSEILVIKDNHKPMLFVRFT